MSFSMIRRRRHIQTTDYSNVNDVNEKECCFWVRERINYCMIDMVTEKVDSGLPILKRMICLPHAIFFFSARCVEQVVSKKTKIDSHATISDQWKDDRVQRML